MPAITVSPVSSSVITWNVGSSLRNRCRALLSRSALSRDSGVIDILITGLATKMFSSVQYFGSLRIGVAARAVDAHDGHDVAGLGRVDFLALVGVHLHDAAEAVLLAGALVEVAAALLDLALVDARERELAELVVDDLERHADERLGRIGLKLDDLRPDRSDPCP